MWTLFFLVFKGVTRIFLDSQIVGGQYVLITAASADGEASSVICVNLGDRFDPNVHSFENMGRRVSCVSIA